MSIDFAAAVDKIYEGRHQEVDPETFQTIGQALLLSEQGHSLEKISKKLGIELSEAKDILIRTGGRELEFQEEQRVNRQSRYGR